MEWREIKKELPEIEKGVLVTDGRDMALMERLKSLYKKELNWYYLGIGGYDLDININKKKISHWMYLPDLPKEGGKEE